MRLLVNHSSEEKSQLPLLMPLMKEHQLTGVATGKAFRFEQLQETAEKTKCEAILISNTETLQNLLGNDATLDNYRGTRLNYAIPAIVINPINHCNLVQHGRWLHQKDLGKFAKIKKPVQPFGFVVCDKEETLLELELIMNDALIISFDIETDEIRRITCISFTGLFESGRYYCAVIPFVDFGVNHYTSSHLLGCALHTMRTVLGNSVPKLAFNGIYDATYCLSYNAPPNNYLFDAMALHWSEFSELPKTLDFVSSLECYDFFQWKGESEEAKKRKDIQAYWAYCGKDSWYTLRCLISQMARLSPTDYAVSNYLKTFKLQYPAIYCAFEGFAVDNEKRLELKDAAVRKAVDLLHNLQVMSASPGFNPASPVQVGKLLYDVLGASKPDKGKKPQYTPTGKLKGPSTDEKALNRIAMQHPLLARFVADILAYRGEVKGISTYYDFVQMNGRALWALDPTGTKTGRMACRQSAFWCGLQLQNVPPYAKAMLKADEGFVLWEKDKNKSEARCVAYLSQCQALINALEGELDFYKVCAANFFQMKYEDVTLEIRNDITKRIIHGTNYVMGDETFVDSATPKFLFKAMSILGTEIRNLKSFAHYLLSLYHRDFPEIKQRWYPEIKAEVAATGMLVGPTGWTRKFFGNIHKDQRVFRAAVAQLPQQLSVELLNEDLWQAFLICLESNGEFRLKGQIHDSILAQIKEGKEKYYEDLLDSRCAKGIMVKGKMMVIPSDTKHGIYWNEMK